MNEMPPSTPTSSTENKKFSFTDLFGFGKVIEKLALHKLTIRMTYCMAFALLLLMLISGFWISGKQIAGFPTAWDYRGMILMCFIVFLVGIWDKIKSPSST